MVRRVKAMQIQEFGGPDMLEHVELADPTPGEGEVVVEIARAGVNFADTHATRNDYLAEQSLPLVPGAEIAGRTPDGRRVAALLGSGGYAEKAVVPEALLIPLPDEVDDDQAAAMLLQGLTALALVKRCARIEAGETIVVEAAAGGTGTLAVQIAKRGRREGDRPRLQRGEARRWSRASAPTPASTPAPRTSATAIREANGGERVDAVLHMSGGDAFDAEMSVLAPLGRMVVFGIASREQRDVSTAALLRGSKTVVGFWLVHLLARRDLAVPMIGELLGAVAAGELRATVGDVYPLSEAARAHEDLIARRSSGKLLLDPSK